MTQQKIGILYASVTSLTWGFLAIALKLSMNFSTPGTVVFFRFAIASIILLSYQLVKHKFQLRFFFRVPKVALFCAATLAGNYYFYMKGIDYMTPGGAQLFIQLAPLAFALTGIFLFKEKFSRFQWIGLCIAISGFALFYKDQIEQFIDHKDIYSQGILSILISAVFWTSFMVLQKLILLKNKVDPQMLNLWTYIPAALFLIPVCEFGTLHSISNIQWGILIFLGFNTLIAYGCLAEANKRAPANQVSIVIILNPLITLVVMNFFDFFDVTWIEAEKISWEGYLGVFLVVSGVITVLTNRSKPRED